MVDGKVICSGPGGHIAIEPAHPANTCPAATTANLASAHEPSEEHCVDVPLGDLELLRPQRDPGIAPMDLHPGVVCLAVLPPGGLNEARLLSSLRTDGESPPIVSDALTRLSCVILLT